MELFLGQYQTDLQSKLEQLTKENFLKRLWQKDYTLWSKESDKEISNRLGWLDLPQQILEEWPRLKEFAQELKDSGVKQLLLLGMGGSSLAAEVYQNTFGNSGGYPALKIIDTTHPLAISQIKGSLPLEETLFIVSSKSGTTLETLSLFYYFWQEVEKVNNNPGSQFVAITDPSSSLEKLALQYNFKKLFLAPADVGGRFSALSVFGLLPAALIGIDLEKLYQENQQSFNYRSCQDSLKDCAAAKLGLAMGQLSLVGRDKLVIVASSSLASFPDWLEQLIAESSGKSGKGILPVIEDRKDFKIADDRFYLFLALAEEKEELALSLQNAQQTAAPYCYLELENKYKLAREYFRFQLATAVAGMVLKINPFNQPDVQLAKAMAKEAMSGNNASTAIRENGLSLKDFLKELKENDYLAIQAFLPLNKKNKDLLRKFARKIVRQQVYTIGFGPRFLHSTGQLHKGGKNNGLFLQIIDNPQTDLLVPGQNYSFKKLIRAQADGDLMALKQRQRRCLRISVGQAEELLAKTF